MDKIDKFCDRVGVNRDDLTSKSRKSSLVLYRQIYCYIERQTGRTLDDIGRDINRNHATVIHSIERIEELISIRDREVLGLLDGLKE